MGCISNASEYIGRKLIFVEGCEMCLATLVEVTKDEKVLKAVFEAEKPAVSCKFSQICDANENPVKYWALEPLFGQRWNVEVSAQEFFPEPDHWQASCLWGGGFRIFFNPLYVERFAQKDISWLDEFYAGIDDDEIDETYG